MLLDKTFLGWSWARVWFENSHPVSPKTGYHFAVRCKISRAGKITGQKRLQVTNSVPPPEATST